MPPPANQSSGRAPLRLTLLLAAAAAGGLPFQPAAAEAPTAWALRREAAVNGQGVWLAQIVTAPTNTPPPALRLADSPAMGQSLTLTREQITSRVREAGLELSASPLGGAVQVRVTRRTRALEEGALLGLLTRALQAEAVRDRGELELQLGRTWSPVVVPDDELNVKLVELGPGGVAPTFVLRFELLAGAEKLGSWQTVLRARIWREVLVAGSMLRRGQSLTELDFVRERRDLLALRDALSALPEPREQYELAESLMAGMPLSARVLGLRPVIHRGAVVEALLLDGALAISLKVEALENGAPGQTVRVRNLATRKEFRGKVRDEQTILVSL